MNVFNIALSGLQAAQTQLNTTANNVANLDTPGYKSQGVDSVDISGGGVAASVTTNNSPASSASGSADPELSQGSNVDLASEMMNLTRAKLLYAANAAVIRVGQQMTGALLDMFDNQDHEQG
jgi:flagellar hook protein FlgE